MYTRTETTKKKEIAQKTENNRQAPFMLERGVRRLLSSYDLSDRSEVSFSRFQSSE